MNVLSLFDGMSCGQIALNRLGIKVDNYFACEIDKYAIEVTQKNFPNTVQLGSVTDLHSLDILLPKIDLVIGGSPCQGFSFAGKQLNFEDPRSKLFFEFVRILEGVKLENPDVKFLLENVRMKQEYRDIISKHLGCEPIEVNSALVSAQNRKRLYWTNIEGVTQPEDKGILLRDILDSEIDDIFYLSEKAITRIERSKFGREYATVATPKTGTLIAGYHKIPSDGIYFDGGVRKRRYTLNECERLQTVPLDYTAGVSNTQRYKMLGNGWTVDVITHIFKNL